jgi:hypothetical protein
VYKRRENRQHQTIFAKGQLKVLSLNGYFDSVTPFYQTTLDLQNMPLLDAEVRRNNLTIKNYPSGHMIYLDGASRTAMKADLAAFYDSTTAGPVAVARHWDWIPPRGGGGPRLHRLRIFRSTVGGPPGAISTSKQEPPRSASPGRR